MSDEKLRDEKPSSKCNIKTPTYKNANSFGCFTTHQVMKNFYNFSCLCFYVNISFLTCFHVFGLVKIMIKNKKTQRYWMQSTNDDENIYANALQIHKHNKGTCIHLLTVE